MTNLPALTKREFTANFYSPMAYVVATFYLIFAGLSFYIILSSERDSNAMRVIAPGSVISMGAPENGWSLSTESHSCGPNGRGSQSVTA